MLSLEMSKNLSFGLKHVDLLHFIVCLHLKSRTISLFLGLGAALEENRAYRLISLYDANHVCDLPFSSVNNASTILANANLSNC